MGWKPGTFHGNTEQAEWQILARTEVVEREQEPSHAGGNSLLITRLESEKKNMITCIDKGSETIVGESEEHPGKNPMLDRNWCAESEEFGMDASN